jgi:hypothetical protein
MNGIQFPVTGRTKQSSIELYRWLDSLVSAKTVLKPTLLLIPKNNVQIKIEIPIICLPATNLNLPGRFYFIT